jgi:hypothetical protein
MMSELTTAAVLANIDYYKALTNHHLDLSEQYLKLQIEHEIILASRTVDFNQD